MVAARVVFVKRDGQGPLEVGALAWTFFSLSSLFNIVARPTASLERSIESGRTIFATVFARGLLT